MNAHRAPLGTRDAAAERGVSGPHRDPHVAEILGGLTHRLEQAHRCIMVVMIAGGLDGRIDRDTQYAAQPDDDEWSHSHQLLLAAFADVGGDFALFEGR